MAAAGEKRRPRGVKSDKTLTVGHLTTPKAWNGLRRAGAGRERTEGVGSMYGDGGREDRIPNSPILSVSTIGFEFTLSIWYSGRTLGLVHVFFGEASTSPSILMTLRQR